MDKNAPLGPDADPALKDACKYLGPMARDIVYKWSKAQKLTFTDQLNAGIRYFDLRISTKDGSTDLYLVHGMYSTPVKSCLIAVHDFITDHEKEVVMLDMNHFYGLSKEQHDGLLQLVQDTFGTKLCPYLDMESMTLNSLWENKLQVICFYRNPAAADNFYFWPGSKIPSPWPNTTDCDTLIKILDENYSKGRQPDSFYVTQGVLTPDLPFILKHLTSSLEDQCSDKAAPSYVAWLTTKKSGANGINICHMDFVHFNDYINVVIALNQKR